MPLVPVSGDMVRCIHIAPELPPTVGGVADYTAILSRRLVEESDGAVEPVLVHAGNEPADEIDVEFPVRDLSGQCSPTALAETVRRLADEADDGAVVLLEYSGYGYAQRGAPLWLAQGLRRACEKGGPPLVSMFHELYATGPPWTSAFWMAPMQRVVAARLARMSGGIVTNRSRAGTWLRKIERTDARPVQVQPVFSNVGEPRALPSFESRERELLIFGGAGRKSAVYTDHSDLLRHLVSRYGFSRVRDIGPVEADVLPGETWSQALGVLPSDEVSDHLSSVSLGVLADSGGGMGKSGVAAAYASHGVPFILFDDDDGPEPAGPFTRGDHFWVGNDLLNSRGLLSRERLEEMSRSIRTLYQKQMHSTHAARCFLNLVDSVRA